MRLPKLRIAQAKDRIKRMTESLLRFPPNSDMHVEIQRQLDALRRELNNRKGVN